MEVTRMAMTSWDMGDPGTVAMAEALRGAGQESHTLTIVHSSNRSVLSDRPRGSTGDAPPEVPCKGCCPRDRAHRRETLGVPCPTPPHVPEGPLCHWVGAPGMATACCAR